MVNSKVGAGSCFEIYLPRIEGEAESVALVSAHPTPGGSETLLLVEDEPALRKMAIRILSQLGYKIIEAVNGVEALKAWEAHSSEISLLLTDIVMPDGVSGLDLARRLQSTSPGLKVIFMSGYSADANTQELELKEGVNFIAKPFGREQLAEIIRKVLDDRSSR